MNIGDNPFLNSTDGQCWICPQPTGSLSLETRTSSVRALTKILAKTMELVEKYESVKLRRAGLSVEADLILAQHYHGQLSLVNLILDRIQALGGAALAAAEDSREDATEKQRQRESLLVEHHFRQLMEAHERLVMAARSSAAMTAAAGDDRSSALITDSIIGLNQHQSKTLKDTLESVSKT